MGIYPKTDITVNNDGILIRVYDDFSGLKTTTFYESILVVEERSTCYCCSCTDYHAGSDPYCRNHGWAGTRPCEVHEMPGDRFEPGWTDDDAEYTDLTCPMLSVQAERACHA